MGCILAPQTGEPTAGSPNPMARALQGTIGSGGTMIWWHRWPTNGGRGLKPLEGRAAAAHFGCCVLCGCVFVVVCAFQLPTGRKSISKHVKWLTFACSYQKKSPNNTPNVMTCAKSSSFIELAHVFTF